MIHFPPDPRGSECIPDKDDRHVLRRRLRAPIVSSRKTSGTFQKCTEWFWGPAKTPMIS